MRPQELEKEIRGWIERFVSQYPQGAERIWRMPLVGFADANSPYLQRLPELVMPGHRLPQDYLEQATVVISYFVPFTKAHGDQNLKGENDLASPSWAQSYLETNRMIEALNLALAEEIRRLGYHAVVPYGIGMDETLFRRADRRRLRPSEVLSDDLQKSGSLRRRLLRKMRCGSPVLLSGSHKIRIHIIAKAPRKLPWCLVLRWGISRVWRRLPAAGDHFMQRYSSVTICPRVQGSSGEKVVAEVPSVMFFI